MKSLSMSEVQIKANYEKDYNDFFCSSNNCFPNYNMIEDKCQSIAKNHAEKLGKLVKHYINENIAVIEHGNQRNFSDYDDFIQFVFEMHSNFFKTSYKSFLIPNCCTYDNGSKDTKRIKTHENRNSKTSSMSTESENLDNQDLENIELPISDNADNLFLNYEEGYQQQKPRSHRKEQCSEVNIFHEDIVFKKSSSKSSKNFYTDHRDVEKYFYPKIVHQPVTENKMMTNGSKKNDISKSIRGKKLKEKFTEQNCQYRLSWNRNNLASFTNFEQGQLIITNFENTFKLDIYSPRKTAKHTKSKYEIYGEDITEIRDIDTVSSQNSKCCFVIKSNYNEFVIKLESVELKQKWLSEVEDLFKQYGFTRAKVHESYKTSYLPKVFDQQVSNRRLKPKESHFFKKLKTSINGKRRDIKTTNIKKKSHESKSKIVKNIENLNSVKVISWEEFSKRTTSTEEINCSQSNNQSLLNRRYSNNDCISVSCSQSISSFSSADNVRLESLDDSLTKLENFAWYHGNMQRKEAESKLTGQPDGTFLVRYSEKHNLHVLTYVRHGISKHSRITIDHEGKCRMPNDKTFSSIVKMLSFFHKHPIFIDNVIGKELSTKLSDFVVNSGRFDENGDCIAF